jgi:ribosomal protein S18 acetylase RimI-like enzyme
MESPLIVRQGKEEDIESLCDIINASRLFIKPGLSVDELPSTGLHDFPTPSARYFYDHYIDQEEDNAVIVAAKEDRPIGLIVAHPFWWLRYASNARGFWNAPHYEQDSTTFISLLAVHPGHRRQGVAGALYAQLFTVLKRPQDVVATVLHEPMRNLYSIAHHEKQGFREMGLFKMEKNVYGVYHKELR